MDIHIDWEGPLSADDASKLRSDQDYGLYQWYGDHPVYGAGVLLYIGKAQDQKLGERFEQSQRDWEKWIPSRPEVYVGRICCAKGTSGQIDRSVIDSAEKVLLFSHSPAFNSKNLNSINEVDKSVRVFNWGMRKSLLPETSVYRWLEGRGHRASAGLTLVQWRS